MTEDKILRISAKLSHKLTKKIIEVIKGNSPEVQFHIATNCIASVIAHFVHEVIKEGHMDIKNQLAEDIFVLVKKLLISKQMIKETGTTKQ